MSSNIKFNCSEIVDYYVSGRSVIEKNVMVVDPPEARDRIVVPPLLDYIGHHSRVALDIDNITWNESGSGIPDAVVPIQGAHTPVWLEHTRIYDSQQHFVDSHLKESADKFLDSIGAPRNLVLRLVEGSTRRNVHALCRDWKKWEKISKPEDAFGRIPELDKANGAKKEYGFIVKNGMPADARIILMESLPTSAFDIFSSRIEDKQSKYGLAALNTILVLDDETRSHSCDSIVSSAEDYVSSINNQFKGIYVISFDYLNELQLPSWKVGAIKIATFS